MTANGRPARSSSTSASSSSRSSRSASTCIACSKASGSRCRASSVRSSASSCGCAASTRSSEQTWGEHTIALLLFSAVTLFITYAILRLQSVLPLNPQKLGAVEPSLAFNTAVSFTTNTNWQAYGGETTMSYVSQMAGLAWHNFISAAAGIGVALALARTRTWPSRTRRSRRRLATWRQRGPVRRRQLDVVGGGHDRGVERLGQRDARCSSPASWSAEHRSTSVRRIEAKEMKLAMLSSSRSSSWASRRGPPSSPSASRR